MVLFFELYYKIILFYLTKIQKDFNNLYKNNKINLGQGRLFYV